MLSNAFQHCYNWGKLWHADFWPCKYHPALVQYSLLIIWKIYYLFPTESRKHTRHIQDIKRSPGPFSQRQADRQRKGRTAWCSEFAGAGKGWGKRVSRELFHELKVGSTAWLEREIWRQCLKRFLNSLLISIVGPRTWKMEVDRTDWQIASPW